MVNRPHAGEGLPPSDLPRERLFLKGPHALADRELIAILLGS